MLVSTLLLTFSSLALASGLSARQQQGASCTSDDSCKAHCRAPSIQAQGVDVKPSEKIQTEALRRFGDFHCVQSKCQCAITSDDLAQDFCKYWIENDKADFQGATYVNGGVDADKNVIYCVYSKVVSS